MSKARVLLADDHKIVLEGLKSLLEPEFELVGSVTDGRALVAAAERLQPDVIVVDISMPLLNGIEAVRQLQTAGVKSKVVFLTMHPDVTYAASAFEAGARGFVLKHSASSELLTAIREALQGKTYVTPLIAGDLLASYRSGARKVEDFPASSHPANGRSSNSWPRAVRPKKWLPFCMFHREPWNFTSIGSWKSCASRPMRNWCNTPSSMAWFRSNRCKSGCFPAHNW